MRGRQSRLLALPVLLFGLLLGGCAGLKKADEEAQEDRKRIVDTNSLISYLQKRGVGLIYEGPFSSSGAMASGEGFQVTSGGQLYVFTYAGGADALQNMSWVNNVRDRSQQVDVYRKEEIVVVSTGDNPRLRRALVRVMGSPVS